VQQTIRQRRSVVAAAAAVSAALALAACGGGSSHTGASGNTSKGGGGGSAKAMTISVPNDKATWANWFNQIGKTIASSDGGVGIKSQPYSSTTAYQAVMDNLVTSPKAPALYTWWSGDQLKLLVNEHAVASITPEVNKWIKDYGLSKEVMDAYKVNGNYYGVPLYAGYWPIFYNASVFKKYNLTPPKTWAQLVHVADTLKAHGVTPFGQLVGSWTGFIWFENILINMDPSLYNQLMLGKASYTSPGVVKVMKFWSALQKDGWFKQFNGAAPTSGMEKSLAQGQIAMTLMGSWDEPTMIQDGLKPGSGFGAFVMPPIAKGLGYQMIYETGPFVVSSKSSQESSAIKAMNAFMEPTVQKKWASITNFISPESKVPGSNSVNGDLVNTVKSEHVDLLNRYWEATPPKIAVAAADEFNKEMVDPGQYMAILQDIQNNIAAPYWRNPKNG